MTASLGTVVAFGWVVSRGVTRTQVLRGLPRRALSSLGGFRQGLFSDLSNPKIAVFFTGLLPQFVSSRHAVLGPFLLLGGLFVLMTLTWLCAYALVAARVSTVLTRPRVKAALDGITGVVLVGFGVRLALERRCAPAAGAGVGGVGAARSDAGGRSLSPSAPRAR